MEKRFPMNLQLFAEPEGTPSEATPPAPQQTDPAAIANALLESLEKLQRHKEPSLVKSYAEKYGLSEEELTATLDRAKAEKAAQLPDAARQQIAAATERANALLVTAEVRSQGAAMGLIDPELALLALKRDGVHVDDKGNVTGVKEALEALKAAKPHLFGAAAKPRAWAERLGASGAPSDGVESAFYKKNPGLRGN